MLRFNCRMCKAMLSVEDRYAGQLARCPTCHSTVQVPAVGTTAAAAKLLDRGEPSQFDNVELH
jgi:DNA-directed RNA polymerase subunit RPC12/RpoP